MGKTVSRAEVAEFDYNAMMKDKTVAIHGVKNKIFAPAVRFLPRTFITNITRKIREKKHI